jgi:hypothetical protein
MLDEPEATMTTPSDSSPPPQVPPHRPADDQEEVYFDGSPLLRGHVGRVLGWGLIGAGAIAAGVLLKGVLWLSVVLVVLGLLTFFIPAILARTVRYRITNYRIDYERGLLSRRIDTLELWHVEDLSFSQSLLDRITGVGNIKIISHDPTTPELQMRGLPNPRALFTSLQQRIIAVKRQRGVIKMDAG